MLSEMGASNKRVRYFKLEGAEGSSGRPKPCTPSYNRKPDGVPIKCGLDPHKNVVSFNKL